jgi:hypothetical protein
MDGQFSSDGGNLVVNTEHELRAYQEWENRVEPAVGMLIWSTAALARLSRYFARRTRLVTFPGCIEVFGGDGDADDVDPVEPGFGVDLVFPALDGEAVIGDGDREVLRPPGPGAAGGPWRAG